MDWPTCRTQHSRHRVGMGRNQKRDIAQHAVHDLRTLVVLRCTACADCCQCSCARTPCCRTLHDGYTLCCAAATAAHPYRLQAPAHGVPRCLQRCALGAVCTLEHLEAVVVAAAGHVGGGAVHTAVKLVEYAVVLVQVTQLQDKGQQQQNNVSTRMWCSLHASM